MRDQTKAWNKVNERNNTSFTHCPNGTLLLFGGGCYKPVFLGFRNSPSSITLGKSSTTGETESLGKQAHFTERSV